MHPKRLLQAVRTRAKQPAFKHSAVIAVLLVTIIAFIRFFAEHPNYIHQLGRVSPWWIVGVVLLNVPMVGLLVLLTATSLALCGERLSWKENFLLTAYSSIVNFFGPLQSGPGVRAVYLKTRHQVRLRDYTLASLLYYGLFAFFSALFLLIGTRPWWQTTLALAAVAGLSYLLIRWFIRKDKKKNDSQFALRPRALSALLIITFLQVLLTTITYFVELKAVNSHITWGQAVSYAGAANFALFVSITPDAIGFRESFLYVSQKLHHVSTANILSANIIDRGAYVIFLVLLFLLVLSMHAKDKLHITGLKRVTAKSDQSPQ
jgi:uncharacterized membrane protein YbhN (UPF0104 family)